MKQIVRRIVQQILLLPAAAWCRLAATGVYRSPDCPSIDDRTKLHFLSSGLSAFLLIACQSMEEDVVYLYTHCGCSVASYVDPEQRAAASTRQGIAPGITDTGGT